MTDVNLMEKEIYNYVPQIPFVVDQVGAAMAWAKENCEAKGLNYEKTLNFALEVAKYVKSISEANFYKTHLLIGAFLMDVEKPTENSKFDIFKTASCSVEHTLEALCMPEYMNEKFGCFKALTMHEVQMAQNNESCFVVTIISMIQDIIEIRNKVREQKEPLSHVEYITILGYDRVLTNVQMSNLNLLNTTRNYLNNLNVLLAKDLKY